ncbi:MAG TPA: DUF4388 domain-containing protein [Trichormus sp.]|jgi:hypothetical protein
MIEGNFKDVSLPGLLQVLGSEVSRNYRVRVSSTAAGGPASGGQSGDIYVARGFVVCASFGLLEGEDAICEFLSWREGTFFVETLTANIEVKKNLKRAISASNAFVENTLYINENNVSLNTVIVASKSFGSVEWQESLRQQPLEREDFVVLGWVGEGRTIRQALREFSFDIAQATAILTRLIKTCSVQVLRPTAQNVSDAPAGAAQPDPVVQRFVTTGGQEAAASSVAQAAARAYAQEATAAVAYDAFISTSFRPGSVPIPPTKNEKSHGNPLLDPIKKIGLDLAQVRASMEARFRSRVSRKLPEEAQPSSDSPTRAVPPPSEAEPRLAQSGQFHLPSASGQHYLSPPSSPANPNPVTASSAGTLGAVPFSGSSGSPATASASGNFGPVPGSVNSSSPATASGSGNFGPVPGSGNSGAPATASGSGNFGPVPANPAHSTTGPGMRLPPPDYVSGQWLGPRTAPAAAPLNAVPPANPPSAGTGGGAASPPEAAQDAINQMIGDGVKQWQPGAGPASFEPDKPAQPPIPAVPPASNQVPAPNSVSLRTPPATVPSSASAPPAAAPTASTPTARPSATFTTLAAESALDPLTTSGKRERTEALPMVTIDIDRLLQATFTPTQFGKLALTNPALDQLRRQTLLDVEAGKTLKSVIAEGARPAAAILNSYRYCLDRGYIENNDPVVSMTTELLLGRMELDQYLLQRRRLTGDQLRDLVEISRKEGVKLTQVLVRSGYLTVGDLDTLEREQKRFAFK